MISKLAQNLELDMDKSDIPDDILELFELKFPGPRLQVEGF